MITYREIKPRGGGLWCFIVSPSQRHNRLEVTSGGGGARAAAANG